MRKIIILLFVLMVCVLSTYLLKLDMNETMMQYAGFDKNHVSAEAVNSTLNVTNGIYRKEGNGSNDLRVVGNPVFNLTYKISVKEVSTFNISNEEFNTTKSTSEIRLQEADARNTTRTVISLQESCKSHTNSVNQWFELNTDCSHKEITEYFLKQFLKLNNNFSQFNNFSNTGDSKGIFRNENITKIGILIPTITRKVNCQNLLQFTLFEKCLRSILNSLSGNFLYKIYIGFDKNDVYFSALNNLTKSRVYTESISLVEVECQTFVAAVNTIAKKAFEEGMDYFVRINDDTVFTTSNWSILAIEVLRNYTPPNVGVVGPTCKEGNTGILTHDMVHRSHLEIFPYYYPPVFENWWADDWITQVYKPNRVRKLETWTVQHLLQNTRYIVDWSIADKLNKAILDGKIKINAYSPVFNQLNISAVLK